MIERAAFTADELSLDRRINAKFECLRQFMAAGMPDFARIAFAAIARMVASRTESHMAKLERARGLR